MNKILQKLLATLLTVTLISCGSNQADTVETQLSKGISVTTKTTDFGKAARPETIAAMSAKLGAYFNGKNASNPQALIGSVGSKSATASVNAGSTATPMIAASNVASPVFRFYNINTGAHFFTMSAAERDYVKNTFPFFTFEGNSFFAYPDSDSTLSPVYRFYNKVTGTHFFTISAEEKAYVQATWPDIFNFEGISWYASADVRTGWVPVYRFFNTKTSTHFYTTSAAERDYVQATWNWFTFEGIAYYVRPDVSVVTPTSGFGLVPNANGGTYDKTECVKDYATGLIWQGQTPAGTGLRANDQYKTHFTSTTELQKESTIVNGVVVYVAPTQAEVDAVTNAVGFTNAVNASNLCGSTSWRMPTKDELVGIFIANQIPRIDNAWFPNTLATSTAPYAYYHTSSPYVNLTTNVWGVNFYISRASDAAIVTGRGNGFGLGKGLIRLVR